MISGRPEDDRQTVGADLPDEVLASLPAPGTAVAIGLSGGVDSAMAAALLVQHGCRVTGVTMAVWDGTVPLPDDGRSGCFGPGEARDIEAARDIAARLGIPHRTIDLADDYRREVLDYFRDEYRSGRTPNPCVRCNRRIKFGLLPARAREAGVDFERFATGHYARIVIEGDPPRCRLRRARDEAKDQTYFLARLGSDQLRELVFPLGAIEKTRVRALAESLGFPDLAAREESQDFVEARNYTALFEAGDARPGELVDEDGRVLGRHRGLIHYTVGQRKGLGIGGAGAPYYVTALDAAANRVVVGRRDHLLRRAFTASDCTWLDIPDRPSAPRKVACRIRRRHPPAPATIEAVPEDADAVHVVFDEPQSAITPGQTAVFYSGEFVLGAGTIELSP